MSQAVAALLSPLFAKRNPTYIPKLITTAIHAKPAAIATKKKVAKLVTKVNAAPLNHAVT